MRAPLREREPVKSSALIAVAASCAVLAAAGAGLASWAVVSAGQAGAAAAAQLAGDDGIFVGDELSHLLLTDAQLATLGIPGSVAGVSAEYSAAPIEASPECAYVLGQTPMEPAGARSIEIADGGTTRFRQQIIQFADADAASATFALVSTGATQCTSFIDDLGTAWSWTTVTSTEAPAVIAGYSGLTDAPDRVIVVALASNAMSFIFADTTASSLTPDELATAAGAAVSARLSR